MTLFKGSGVALITPFKDGKVDESLFIDLIEWQIKNKTAALIIGGTTGESATLSYEEKCRIYALAVSAANHQVPVIANTGTNNTLESIALSKAAEDIGVDGLLLVTPYYNKPTQKGLFEHFKAISNAVSLPIILYNVPSRTSVNLSAKTTIELSHIPNIIGIKEASGDLGQVKEILANTQSFQLFSGNDDLIFDTLSLGGDGVISVVANIAPLETQALCQLFEFDKRASKQAQKRLDILNDVLFIESNPVPVKTAFKMLGVDVGGPRLPLVEMESAHITLLKEALNAFGLKEIHL